jgi:hypothetical protein
VCFVDFSKAFDKINYWKLLNKLLDDDVDNTGLLHWTLAIYPTLKSIKLLKKVDFSEFLIDT